MQQAALNPADTPTQRLKRLASMLPQAFDQRPAVLHRRHRRATPADGTIAERA